MSTSPETPAPPAADSPPDDRAASGADPADPAEAAGEGAPAAAPAADAGDAGDRDAAPPTADQDAAPAGAYPEHDRLGPMAGPTGPMSFNDGGAVRARVIAAVRAALEPARTAPELAHADPDAAVHEVRKAIRRTRALVDAVARVLSRSERRDIRRALVKARRSLGPARDVTVTAHTLSEIAAASDLGEPAAAIADAARGDAPSPDDVAADVARAVEVALAQADALAAALPDDVKARAVVRGVVRTYRRARQARRLARRKDRAVHRWRRRSKELSYQLVLLADIPVADMLRVDLSDLDDRLGKVVDRLMVKEVVGLYGVSSAPDALEALLTAIDDELDERRKHARRASRDLFALRPRKLRRRLLRGLVPDPHPLDPGDLDDIAATD